MSTLQDIISGNLSLTRAQLKTGKGLVREIQTKLSALGFYPGGQWIYGDLGGLRSYSWNGLVNFCTTVGIASISSDTVSLNTEIAKKLLETSQVNSVLDQAKDISYILEKLKKIQIDSLIANGNTEPVAFISRTINNSPVENLINNYPIYLEQKPNGTSLVSYGDSLTLSTGLTIAFGDYPNLGDIPSIDPSGLDFLSSNITHGCKPRFFL